MEYSLTLTRFLVFFVLTPGSLPQTPVPTQQPQVTVTTGNPDPLTLKPTTIHHSGSGTTQANQGSKFIMELNEPGKELPNQTRKYLLYFSQPVNPALDSTRGTITFTPSSGGKYNGIMQLAYLGAGPRGDPSHNNDLDQHLGIYPYKPITSYCVSEEVKKTFVSFDWNPNNQHADKSTGELIMVTMPHHVS